MVIISRNPRLFGIAFIGLLVLNLFLFGLLIGMYQHPPCKPPPEQTELEILTDFKLPPILRDLPPSTFDRVQPIVEKYKPTIQAQLQQLRQVRQSIHTQLMAETLDRQQLDNTFKQVRDIDESLKNNLHQGFIEILDKLTVAERQAFAEKLNKPIGNRLERLEKRVANYLRERDSDKNGELTQTEFTEGLPPRRQAIATERFKHLDKNNDGVLTESELEAFKLKQSDETE